MAAAAGIVDAWAQQPTDRFMAEPWLASLLRWTGQERRTPSLDELLAAMDAAGVELALLSAWHGPRGALISNDEVAGFVAEAPDRLRGVASVDLEDPMGAVREVRRCVGELGFVAVRALPWLWGLPPDDRRFYPVYVACVEHGVPFGTQVGHTGPLRPSEPGRPIPYLDNVLLDFPELVLVAGHVGVPWVDEVVSLADKHAEPARRHVGLRAHPPPAGVHGVDARAGPDAGPVRLELAHAGPARCLEGLDGLGLDDEARQLFLGGNARRVFAL